MIYAWWIAGIVLALAWASRVIDARAGMRSIADISRTQWDQAAAAGWPRVSVIVPARNEQESIEQALASLIAQDYAALEIIAVDDRSSDRGRDVCHAAGAESGERVPGSRGCDAGRDREPGDEDGAGKARDGHAFLATVEQRFDGQHARRRERDDEPEGFRVHERG